MSVLVKGMGMPKNGYDCPLCRNGMCRVADYNSDGICLVYGPDEEHRPSDCPLVSVPPHGRLIDADMLKTKFCIEQSFADGVYAVINNMPTVIEPEEEYD